MGETIGIERLMMEGRRAAALGWLAREDGPCRIKLCGMFRDEDIDALNAAMPDLCGMIVAFPKSHRNVTRAFAQRLAAQADERIYRTIVLVDQTWQHAAYYAGVLDADIIQLHGHEDNDYIHALRSRLHIGIIQAFRMAGPADVERALASDADMVLLDAGQGSGRSFDWSLVEGVGSRRPFMLAGGLTPRNVAQAVRELHPWGVDMSSGIETDRLKDAAKMREAVAAVRSVG